MSGHIRGEYFLLLCSFVIVTVFFSLVSCVGKTSDSKANVLENEKATPNSKAHIFNLNFSDSLKEADSIIIVSHESTNCPQRDEKTGKTLPAPKLIVNEKPNDTIIHERKRLIEVYILKLDSILTAPAVASETATTCFQPRHALFIYKKGKLSYIDFCFDCYGYSVSTDLKTDLILDDPKWDRLLKFYKEQGFKYELY